MDDITALRLEKIRLTLAIAAKGAEVQSHRHVAILAVALTLGGGAAIGGFAGQIPPLASLAAGAGACGVVLLQFRGLAVTAKSLMNGHRTAMVAIDKLMASGGESHGDGPGPDEGGTPRGE